VILRKRLPASSGRALKEKKTPAVENDPLPIQIPRGDTNLVQFKEEKLIQLGHFFFSGEKQKFRLSQRFWPPTGYVAT